MAYVRAEQPHCREVSGSGRNQDLLDAECFGQTHGVQGTRTAERKRTGRKGKAPEAGK